MSDRRLLTPDELKKIRIFGEVVSTNIYTNHINALLDHVEALNAVAIEHVGLALWLVMEIEDTRRRLAFRASLAALSAATGLVNDDKNQAWPPAVAPTARERMVAREFIRNSYEIPDTALDKMIEQAIKKPTYCPPDNEDPLEDDTTEERKP